VIAAANVGLELARSTRAPFAAVGGPCSSTRCQTATTRKAAFPNADWPSGLYVVQEGCFAVNIYTTELRLSSEHRGFAWLDYAAAHGRLTGDSNRVALWEFTQRLNEQFNKPLKPASGGQAPSPVRYTLAPPLAAGRQR
jgi:hypothetical protein